MRVELSLALMAFRLALGSTPEQKQEPEPEVPAGFATRSAPPLREHPKRIDQRLAAPGDSVDASDALDEMIADLAADLVRLGAANVSPILLDRVRLSSNMNAHYAPVVEARIASAIAQADHVELVHCAECWSVEAHVEDGVWVVRQGVDRQADLQRLASDYHARMILTVDLSLLRAPDSLAMDVELVRPDGGIAFAESYRVHPYTAMVYRGADKAQQREARLQELEDRIAKRPHFGTEVMLGAMMLNKSTSQGSEGFWGAFGGVRLYELFGEEDENRIGVSVGGFLNTQIASGALLTAGFWHRVTSGNVYAPECLLGGSAGAFVTGSPGNAVYLAANLNCRFIARIGLEASLGYMPKFTFADQGYEVGGITPELGVSFTW